MCFTCTGITSIAHCWPEQPACGSFASQTLANETHLPKDSTHCSHAGCLLIASKGNSCASVVLCPVCLSIISTPPVRLMQEQLHCQTLLGAAKTKVMVKKQLVTCFFSFYLFLNSTWLLKNTFISYGSLHRHVFDFYTEHWVMACTQSLFSLVSRGGKTWWIKKYFWIAKKNFINLMELSKYLICQYLLLLHCYVLLFKSELDMKKKKKTNFNWDATSDFPT